MPARIGKALSTYTDIVSEIYFMNLNYFLDHDPGLIFTTP